MSISDFKSVASDNSFCLLETIIISSIINLKYVINVMHTYVLFYVYNLIFLNASNLVF